MTVYICYWLYLALGEDYSTIYICYWLHLALGEDCSTIYICYWLYLALGEDYSTQEEFSRLNPFVDPENMSMAETTITVRRHFFKTSILTDFLPRKETHIPDSNLLLLSESASVKKTSK